MGEANNPARKSGKSKLPMAVVSILLAGAGAYYSWSRTASSAEGASQPVSVPAVLHLETFTVNVDDPDQRTYLRVGIDLGLDHDLKDDKNRGALPTAVIRDTILNVLMATKPQDITTVDGKRKLKEQVLVGLQQRVPSMGVREVYFTEFLVQR